MNKSQLVEIIRAKQSFLCIGLDTDLDKIPSHYPKTVDSLFAFNREIIDATLEFTVSYKLNLAFYEAYGLEGWKAFTDTVEYLKDKSVFIIADAKRGDIGNTSKRYAKAFFETAECDAVTVNPYMGSDSVTPFLGFDGKWVIALGLTSNKGAQDLELEKLSNGDYVYEHMLKKLTAMGSSDELMLVIGATQQDRFEGIRALAPDYFLLMPGVGAQGASVEDLRPLITKDIGVLVNSSRQVIYASSGPDFAEAARSEAMKLRDSMKAMM